MNKHVCARHSRAREERSIACMLRQVAEAFIVGLYQESDYIAYHQIYFCCLRPATREAGRFPSRLLGNYATVLGRGAYQTAPRWNGLREDPGGLPRRGCTPADTPKRARHDHRPRPSLVSIQKSFLTCDFSLTLLLILRVVLCFAIVLFFVFSCLPRFFYQKIKQIEKCESNKKTGFLLATQS